MGRRWGDWARGWRSNRTVPSSPSLPPNLTPSEDHLIKLLLALSIVVVTCIIIFKQSNGKALLQSLGVSFRRVTKTMREIERKGFHLAGILVPFIHTSLLRAGVR